MQLILDGTDSNTAGIVLNYASRIVGELQHAAAGGRRLPCRRAAGSRSGGVELASRAWYNENLESRNFYVPAVITNIVFIITMLLSSMAVVREKEIGTIEQVIVTPIGKAEFILGKTVPFVLIGFINVAIISLVAVFWFEVPLRGSIPAAVRLHRALPHELARHRPADLHREPDPAAGDDERLLRDLSRHAPLRLRLPRSRACRRSVQWLTYLNPMRFFLVIIRAIFQKGVGIEILWPQLLALLDHRRHHPLKRHTPFP